MNVTITAGVHCSIKASVADRLQKRELAPPDTSTVEYLIPDRFITVGVEQMCG